MTKSPISLQEPARPLCSDDDMPLYVLSIQERAEQLASQFEGKPVRPKVKLPYRHRTVAHFFWETCPVGHFYLRHQNPPFAHTSLLAQLIKHVSILNTGSM